MARSWGLYVWANRIKTREPQESAFGSESGRRKAERWRDDNIQESLTKVSTLDERFETFVSGWATLGCYRLSGLALPSFSFPSLVPNQDTITCGWGRGKEKEERRRAGEGKEGKKRHFQNPFILFFPSFPRPSHASLS